MSGNTMIAIENLSKVYCSGKEKITALEDVNLQVQKGEIFGIIGMSGAGKSTLVRCINLLERPSQGKVILDGVDLATLSPAQLRKARQSIGMVFQQFNLMMQRTVLDNVCFPLEVAGVADARAKATEMLRLVGLEDKATAYPAQLSGGQKQRVGIARALATDPKVLLCDEATSALDPQTTGSILELLREINKNLGITIVLITHEMDVIQRICHRVAIIDEAHIAECGRVEDVFSRPQSLAAQKMFFPEGRLTGQELGSKRIRVVFEGGSTYQPVIANMILECGAPVNILFADMRDMDGSAYGQMVLELPQNADKAQAAVRYLQSRKLALEEVADVV